MLGFERPCDVATSYPPLESNDKISFEMGLANLKVGGLGWMGSKNSLIEDINVSSKGLNTSDRPSIILIGTECGRDSSSSPIVSSDSAGCGHWPYWPRCVAKPAVPA